MTTATSINDKLLNAVPGKSEQTSKALYQGDESQGFNKILDNLQQNSLDVENKINSDRQISQSNQYSQTENITNYSDYSSINLDTSSSYKKQDDKNINDSVVQQPNDIVESQSDITKQSEDTVVNNTKTSVNQDAVVAEDNSNVVSTDTKQNTEKSAIQTVTQGVVQDTGKVSAVDIAQTAINNVTQPILNNEVQSAIDNTIQPAAQAIAQVVQQNTSQDIGQVNLDGATQSTKSNVVQDTSQAVTNEAVQNKVQKDTADNTQQAATQNTDQTTIQPVAPDSTQDIVVNTLQVVSVAPTQNSELNQTQPVKQTPATDFTKNSEKNVTQDTITQPTIHKKAEDSVEPTLQVTTQTTTEDNVSIEVKSDVRVNVDTSLISEVLKVGDNVKLDKASNVTSTIITNDNVVQTNNVMPNDNVVSAQAENTKVDKANTIVIPNIDQAKPQNETSKIPENSNETKNTAKVDNSVDLFIQLNLDETKETNLAKNTNEIAPVIKNAVNKEVVAGSSNIKTEKLDINTDIKINDDSNNVQIKVSGDTDIKNIKNTDSKISDDLKDKSVLKQNIIDELKAEVNNSKREAFNSNLLGNQSASEQVIKLSINSSLNNANNTDFLNIVSQQNLSLNSTDKVQFGTTQTQTSPAEISKVDILSQINDKLNTLKTSSGDKIEIILRPENLGRVNVELQSNKGQITATLVAENASVKEALEKNLESLKNNLSNQGVQVNNVVVKVEESDKPSFNNLNLNQEQTGKELTKQQKNPQASDFENYGNNSILNDTDYEIETNEVTNINNDLNQQDSKKENLVDYKV